MFGSTATWICEIKSTKQPEILFVRQTCLCGCPLPTPSSVLERFLQWSFQVLEPYELLSASPMLYQPQALSSMETTICPLEELWRPLTFQNMNSQKREICPRRPRFSLTPMGSHRENSLQILSLSSLFSLPFFLSPVLSFSPPSPLPFTPGFEYTPPQSTWTPGCFSKPVN